MNSEVSGVTDLLIFNQHASYCRAELLDIATAGPAQSIP